MASRSAARSRAASAARCIIFTDTLTAAMRMAAADGIVGKRGLSANILRNDILRK
jgi:hypothetical protein